MGVQRVQTRKQPKPWFWLFFVFMLQIHKNAKTAKKTAFFAVFATFVKSMKKGFMLFHKLGSSSAFGASPIATQDREAPPRRMSTL